MVKPGPRIQRPWRLWSEDQRHFLEDQRAVGLLKTSKFTQNLWFLLSTVGGLKLISRTGCGGCSGDIDTKEFMLGPQVDVNTINLEFELLGSSPNLTPSP